MDEGLGLLLEVLSAQVTGREAESHEVQAAMRGLEDVELEEDQPEWTARLDMAARALGIRVRWIRADVDTIVGMARADLPIVTWVDFWQGSGWWVSVEGQTLGRVYSRQFPSARGSDYLFPERFAEQMLNGDAREVRFWGILEPASPAQSMAGGAMPAVRRALSLLSSEREAVWGVALFSITVGILSLATPLTIQLLINWLTFGAIRQPLIVLSIGLLISLSLAALLRALMRLAVEMIQRRVFVRTVMDLSWRLPRVRVSSFDRTYGPELVNRFFDVLTVQKSIGSLFIDALGAGLGAIVGLTLLAFYHPILLGFAVFLGLGAWFILWPLGKGAEKTAIKESKSKYRVAGWLEELARQPLVFKLGGEPLAMSQAEDLSRAYLKYREAHFTVFFRQLVGSQSLQVIASVALLGVCGWLVIEGQLSIGQLVAAEFIVTSALTNFTKLTEKLESLYDLLASADKLGVLVDLPVEPSRGIWRRREGGGAAVGLDGVGFSYPSCRPQLTGLNLNVRPGERVSILGGNASGKSTLADIILGVRRPSSGLVRRDGVNVEELRPERYYDEVALLRGDEIIWGTLEENIHLGRQSVTAERVMDAIELAGLTQVIAGLSERAETKLNPNGQPLSDEERRRVLLARAIAGRPRLIVIDGWLDHMGTEAHALLDVLIKPSWPWTVIVLTEDPEIAGRLNRKLHLSEGRLNELALGIA